jgi:hypothetical protein
MMQVAHDLFLAIISRDIYFNRLPHNDTGRVLSAMVCVERRRNDDRVRVKSVGCSAIKLKLSISCKT